MISRRWADPEDEHRAQATIAAHIARRSEWIPLQYRCLQAIHKATGKVLDDTCDLKLTPDSWRFLAESSTAKYIRIPTGFGIAEDELSRLDPHRSIGMLCAPPKPTTSVPGTTSEDMRYILDQLEYRVFYADIAAHLVYTPTGMLRRHTVLVMGCRMTDEVRSAAEVAKGVYEPVAVSEAPVEVIDDGLGAADEEVEVQSIQDRLYVDVSSVEARGSVGSGSKHRARVTKRFKQLRVMPS